ncbi:hypothetical protein RHSIM_Rhsim07G0100500 [Rhododendron simsii]|uniref:Clp R domain-containing protein n=1 Tax=Rhododendron simsii TaxID=118357 RepID=A0A834GSY0_RHOSS|nr:hypothetical protein RHSIM_Rhsim07G0100500 [Rhododendron simsii]
MAARTPSLSPNTTRTPHYDCRRPNSIFPPLTQFLSLKSLNTSWLGTSKLPPIRIPPPEHRPISATALSSLPTAKPERVFSPTEEVPKWSLKAIKSFAMAELEARKLNTKGIGTEALLLGILLEDVPNNLQNKERSAFPSLKIMHIPKNTSLKCWNSRVVTVDPLRGANCGISDPMVLESRTALQLTSHATNLAANFLWANGITLFKAREEAVKLYAEQKEKAIKLYGKRNAVTDREPPPLTESAQRAVDWAFDKKLKSGESGEITPAHLLLGVWSEKESYGYKIMSALGFNDEKAKQLETLISKPGIGDD